MDKKKIAKGTKLILEGIGEDPDRPGLKDTPNRVARMMAELCSGLNRYPGKEVSTFFQEDYQEMVVLDDIPFQSLCEHHLLPILGKASIVYMPKNGRIVGASKLARALEVASSRPQIQERLTSQVADVLMEKIEPYGVLVKIRAEHLCMTIRGVKKPGSKMVTSAIRGKFKTDKAARDEALTLISENNNI
ncbi:GTP cyclohydrolase I FolE [Candidatus Bipolaricaulota bacterium]|nr:GTP cyclohydrolase I FolE [Candidatus Bipolaricaulota bacterium]MBS3814778.1 GTP cyclohydrolase I FolE [Candidatus Bipolaricaulota bacterium]MBS3825032.1 GTP cyclohydrolase I FolE [Candidatus Bipolaricaulota bacterium]